MNGLLEYLPVLLLIIWVLNHVLARPQPAQPPQRGGRPGQPPVADPFAGRRRPSSRPIDMKPEPARPVTMRPGEEIVILSNETRGQRPGASAGQGGKKANRRARQAAASSVDPSRMTVGGEGAGGLGTGQATAMRARFADADAQTAMAEQRSTLFDPIRPDSTAAHPVLALRRSLQDRSRIRESLILSELLRPPLALREKGRRRG